MRVFFRILPLWQIGIKQDERIELIGHNGTGKVLYLSLQIYCVEINKNQHIMKSYISCFTSIFILITLNKWVFRFMDVDLIFTIK